MSKISYLAGAYFHQDYDLDAGTPDGVLRLFAEQESADVVSQLVVELGDVLSSNLEEPELHRLWDPDGISTSYRPSSEGRTYREWFAHIRDVLTAHRSLG